MNGLRFKFILTSCILVFSLFSSTVISAQCFTNLNPNYCTDDASFVITGSCTSYFGPGVSGTTWDPGVAGIGTHVLYGIDGPVTTYSVDQSGSFNPDGGSGTAITLGDDDDDLIAIPFTFNFYGNNYTNVNVVSNGFLRFSGSGFASTPQNLPDVTIPNDLIAFAWDDLDPSAGGLVEYYTIGVAPLRTFIVNYKNVPHYSASPPSPARITVQVQLHESTNIIEIHSSNIDSDGGSRTQGVENSTGGSAIVVSGRNDADWTAVNDYVAFIPDNVVSQSVTVNPVPSTALTLNYSSINVCESETITIEVVGSVPGIGYQIFDDTPVAVSGLIGGNGGSIFIATSALSNSQNSLFVRALNSSTSCSSDFATQAITVDVQSVANAGTGGDICGKDGTNPFTFTGIASTGSGLWTKTSGPGTENFVLATSATTNVTVDTYGTYVFRWTETNGTCNDFDEIAVTFDVSPIADADRNDLSPYSECDLNFVLDAVPSVGGSTGSWTKVSGGGIASFGNANSPTTNVSVGIYDTYVFEWTEVNGACNDTDQVTVIFRQQPIADAYEAGATTNFDECGLTHVVDASTATGTGTWSKTSGPGTLSFGTNANDPDQTLSVDAYGTYIFRWTDVNGTCSDFDELTVNFYESPSASTPGGAITQCNNTTFTLAATPPAVGIGTWSVQSGFAVTITNVNSATTTVTGLTAGNSSVLLWTVSNGSCSDNTNTVTITNEIQPIADAYEAGATTNFDECGLTHVVDASTATGTGTWSKTSGPGTLSFGTNANDPDQTLSVDAYGTYIFRWTDVNGTCSDFDELTVNFYESPSASTPGGAITQCNNTTFTLAATPPAVGIGTWSVQSGFAVTITNVNSATTTVTGLTAGNSSVLLWTVSNGSCSDNTNTVTITNEIQPIADAYEAGATTNFDECGLTHVVDASTATGTGTWSKTSGPGTLSFGTNANDPDQTLSVDAYGTYIFRWTDVNGTCSDFDELTVNFYESPSASTPGGAITQCNNTTFTLAATPPAVGIGTWSVQSGFAVTITNVNSATTTVTGLTAGNSSVLLWTVSNGSCSDNTNTVTITNEIQPIADAYEAGATTSFDECGLTHVVDASTATGTGTWSKTSGPGTLSFGTNANDPDQTLSVDAYGTYIFRWTDVNGTCSDFDELTVNFYESPSASAPGGAITQCNNTTFTLAATPPAVGIGTWSVQSGFAVTITNVNSATTTVTGLTAGNSSVLLWTVSNGSCSDNTNTVTITNEIQPIADAYEAGATTSFDECGLTHVVDASTATGTGTWSKTSGPGTLSFGTNANDPDQTLSVDAYGTYIFRWTDVNGTCSDFDELTVNFYESPSASAPGGAITQCNNTTFTLAATPPAVGIGTWSVQSGFAVTITNVNSATTTVTGLTAGNSSVLLWTVSNGSCSDNTNTVTITNEIQPIADAYEAGATTNFDECGLTHVVDASTATGTGTWSKTSGPGTLSFGTNANDPDQTLSVDAYGTYIFRWTDVNGTCSDFDELTVNFYESPSASTPGGAITQCNNTTFTLAATPPAVGIGTWSVQSGFAVTITNVNSATTTVTGLTAGNSSVLLWTVSNGSCSDNTNTVTITNEIQPIADAYEAGATTSFDECGLTHVVDASTATGTGTWSKTSGPGTLSFGTNANDPDQTLSVDAYGTYIFRWTDVNGTCSDFDELTVNFYESPSASAPGGAITQCNNTTFTLAATPPAVGIGTWSVQSGFAVTITNVNSATTTVTGLTAGNSSVLLWTVSNGSCSDNTNTVTITNEIQPIADAYEAGATTSFDECGLTHVVDASTATGTGTWSKTSGPGTLSFGTNANDPDQTLSVDAYGTYIFRWTDVNGTCSDFDELTVNFYESPSASTPGGAITQCNNTTFTLAATPPAVGIGTWSVQSGFAVTITNVNSATTTVTGLTAGNSSVLLWTVSNGSCSDNTNTVTITNEIQPIADAYEAGATTNFDECGLTHVVDASTATGTGTWSKTSGPGTLSFGTNANDPDQTLSVDAYGTYIFRWTDVNGTCSDFDELTVNFYESPSASTPGGAITQCNNTTFTLAATPPAVGIGTWSVQSGFAVTITNVNSATTTVTGLTAGNSSVLLWTVSNGSCSDNTNTVTITNEIQPIADAYEAGATTNFDECGLTHVVDASTATGTGTWSKTSGPGTLSFGTNANDPDQTLSVDAYGTYIFRWTDVNGTCSDFDELTVNFYESPSASTPGGAITQCNNTTFTLAATPPAVGIGTWSVQSGFAVTITNVNSATTTVTGLTAGNSSVLLWTVSNGSCSDNTNTVTITNEIQPIADAYEAGATTSFDECGLTHVVDASTATGTGTWSKTSGPGTLSFGTNANDPDQTLSVDAYGTYIFRWTDVNGTCSDFDELTVNFYESPSASAPGGAITQCNNTTFTLAATPPAVGIGTWSVQSGFAVTITNVNSATTTVTGLTAGNSSVLLWTVSNGSCSDNTNTVTITNEIQPIADAYEAGATTNFDECGLTHVVDASTATGTGTWSKTSGPGTLSFGTNANDPDQTLSVDAYGTYIFRWTDVNGTCSDFDELTVNFYESPSASTPGGAITQCNNTTFTLAATPPAVGIGTWSVQSGFAVTITNVNSATTTVTGLTAGNSSVLLWTVSNGSCSDNTNTVTITNEIQPIADAYEAGATTSFDECGLTHVVDASTATGTGTWSKTSGPGTLSFGTNANDPDQTLSVDAYGTYIFRWTDVNGTCSDFDELTVNFYESPSASAPGGAITQCNNTTFTLAATPPAVGIGTWSVQSGFAVTITNVNSATTTVTGLTAGNSSVLLWTVSNGSCSDNTNTVTITNEIQPIADAYEAGATTSFDECGLTHVVDASTATGTGTWSKTSGPGTLSFGTNANDPDQTLSVDAYGTYIFRWTDVNGTCSDFDELTVNFYESPSASAPGGAITQCNNTTFTLAATPPAVGIGTWSVQSGFAVTITNVNSATTTVTGLTAGNSSVLLWTVSNGSCSDNTNTVTITNEIQPIADAYEAGATTSFDECGLTHVVDASTATGTGTWSKTSGPGTLSFGTNANDPDQTLSVDAYGTYIFRWTDVNGTCSDFDELTVNFYESPSASTPGGAITQCNNTTFTLAATPPAVGIGTWSVQSGFAVTITNVNSATTTVTGLTAGNSSVLLWTVSNGSCSDNTNTVTITNEIQPIADAYEAGATTSFDECGLTHVVDASTATGTGTWSKTSGPGTLSFGTNANDPDQTLSVDAYGTYIFRWTDVNGTCSDFDELTVNFYESPSASAPGGAITQCNNTTFTLAATPPAVGIGTWSVQSGFAVTITNVNSATTTVTGLTAGNSSVLLWTVSNGSCSDNTNTVTITNEIQPIADAYEAGATTSFDECGLTHVVDASTATGTGTWSKTSGPGTLSFGTNANDPDQTLSVDAYGTYIFRWTDVNGTCSDFDELTVNFYETPDVSTSAQSICSTSTTNVIISNPNGVSGTTYNWTIGTVTGVVAGQAAGGGNVISQSLTTDSNGGTVEYLIVASANGCSSVAFPVVVTVDPVPNGNSVPAGTNIVCSGTTLAITPTTDVVGTTFTWTGNNGSGGSGNITNTPINNTNSAINITYTVTPTGPGATACKGSDFTIVVTVNPNPTLAITNAATSICSGDATAITLNSTTANHVITVTNMTYGAVTGGIVSVSDTYTDGNTIIETLENPTDNPISVIYEFTITTTDGCPVAPTPQTALVTVGPRPDMSITNIVTDMCSGESTDITLNSTVTGAVMKLTSVGNTAGITGFTSSGVTFTDGEQITDALINTTANPVTITYNFTVSAGGCDDGVAPFTTDVTINPNPTLAITNAATSICSGDATAITLNSTTANHVITVTNMTYGAVTGGIVSVSDTYTDGNTIIETLENPTDNPISVIYEFTITTTDGCPVAPTPQTALVTVGPRPDMSITNIVTDMCSGESTDITLNSTVTGAVMKLTSVSNTAGITGFTSSGVTFTDGEQITDALINTTANPVTLTYNFTVSAGGCDDGVAPFTTDVTINPNPTLAITNAATSICSGDATAITLNSTTANHVITVTNMTYGAVTGGIVSVSDTYTDGNTIIETLENPTDNPISVIYEFTITTTDGCPVAPTPQTALVTVGPRPDMSITNIVTDMCSGESTDITLNSTVTGAVMKLTSVSNTAGITGFTSSGVTFTDGEQITDALINTTANPVTLTYNFTVSAGGCDDGVAPFTTDVTINPNPTLAITNAATSICSGDATAITLNSTTANHVITVTNMTYGAVTGGIVSVSDTYTDGNTIIETLENPTDNPISVIYEFTITTTDGCPVAPTPQTALVTVGPRPDMSITNIVTDMCSGESTDITLNSTVTGAVMKLTSVSNTAGITGFTSSGVTFTDGEQITDALINTTANPVTITYNFTVSAGGCDDGVAPFTTDVTINPNPTLAITNAATSICSGDATAITLNSTTANHVITVTNMTYGAVTGGIVSVSDTYTDGNTIIETLENPTDNPISVIYEFTITTTDGCPVAPTPQTALVTVGPRPDMSITNIVTDMCSGESTDITLNSTVTGAVMKLTSVSNTAGITGFTSSGVTFTDGEQITDALINTTANPVTITYNFTVSAGGCDDGVAPFTTDVTINPNPTLAITNAATSICSGDATAITLNSTTANHVITVTNMTYGAVTGGIVSVSDTYTDGNTIIETLENPTDNPISVIYEFTITTTDGCPVAPTPQTALVTVGPRPDMSITNIVTDMCSGESTDITLNSTVTGAVMKLTSVSNTAGITGFTSSGVTFTDGEQITDALINTTANPVTITYNFTVSAGGCDDGVAPFTTDVTINPNPTLAITNAATSICSGDATAITLNSTTANHVITVTNMTYGAVTGGIVSVSDTYTDGNTIIETLENPTDNPISVIYEFTITTTDGCPVAPTPQTALVTVGPRPDMSITNIVTDMCSGESTDITLNSTVTGAVMKLTSVSNTAGITGFTSSGVTFTDGEQITDALINTTANPVTITYNFTVSAGGCDDGVAPFTTDVTINPNPTLAITNAATSICSGDATAITLNSTTANHVITVTNMTYGAVTGGIVSVSDTYTDGNTIIETLENPTDNPISVIYEFTITTTDGCPVAPTPQTALVTVGPRPDMSITNIVTDMCSGESTDITLNSTVTGAVMKLTSVSNTAGITGFTSSGVTFTDGEQITDALINTTANPVTITYNFTVSAGGCDDGVAPFTTDVTINPNPTLAITNAATSICSGDAVDITLNSATLNHQINLISVNYGAVTGGTASGPYTDGNKITEVLNNNTSAAINITYEFNVTTSDGCPLTPTSQFTTVTVSPAPTFNVINNSPIICSEELSDIDITSTTTGAVIELVNVIASSVQIVGTPAIGSTYLNGANISNQLRNPTNSVQTVTYEFDVKLNNCVNPTSRTIVITINPIPTLQTSVAAQTICDGDMTNIVLTNPNSVANTNFSWTVIPSAGISGASDGSGGPTTAAITQTLSNSGNSPGTATYIIKPTANLCDGASRTIIVTVNPTPTLATTGDETVCSGETTNIMLSNPNSVASTSFSWVVLNNINSVSGAVNGSGTAITQSLFVNSNSPAGSVTYRITPSANNCDGSFQDVVVTVNPLPVAFAGFDYEICADGEVVLIASLTGSATSGTWSGGNNVSGFSNNPVIDNEEISYVFDQTDSLAGSVTFTLTTNDSDGAGPCSSASDQITVVINSLPIVSFTTLPDSIAENDPAIPLFGSPSGGAFTGDGISGNSFNPAGGNVLEDNFVTYTYTNPTTGCTNSQTQSTFINGKPVIVIGNQNVQICETSAPDLLEADPSGGTWTGTGVVNIGGTNYEFRPADAGIGTYTLTYTFTDSNNATNSADLVYEVYPTAIVDFEPVNLCFDAPIQFNDLSTVDQTPVASNISSIEEWSWQFFDSDNNIIGASDIQDPTIIFNTPGDKKIILTVISKSGTFTCSSSATETITIGSVPDTRFKWQSVCNGDFTAFNDDTILDIGSIINYEWDFDDGNIVSGPETGDASENHSDGSVTQGNFKNPEHKYVNVGDYDVILTVSTNEGCVKSYTQNIDILPQTQITDFPYAVNFDESDGDWAEEVELQRDTSKVSDNSWLYSNVGSGDINPKYSGDGFWWTGNNSGTYYNSEHSWVNGPCFDFSAVERPMISMKIASSTDKGFDGAVLQSSIDGGLTWQNIGNLVDEGGINWYNSNAISAKPGGQAFGFGWTGNENDIKIDSSNVDVLNWIEVRHNLNGLKGLSNVLLRVAFGSNSDNSASQKSGFAFDDVYVGEKNRLVLIEHFTDSDYISSRNMDKQLYDLGQAQLADFGAIDFTTLQYHINQSGNDLFNLDNPGDPSARSLYYGVSQAPATVSDGIRYADDPTKLTNQIIDKRSLTDPLFNITIDTLSTTSDVLSVRAVFEANTAVNENVTLQIAVVESNIVRNGVTYRNVLKKLLLGGEGQSVNTSWTVGQKQTITYDWNVDVEIFNPENLSIIAFVQNKTTHEIYGTALIKGQIQDESTVTSIGEDLLDQVRQISIYPNPASNELNFQLTEIALEDYSWAIVDQRGISIISGAMEFNSLGVQTINTSQLKNGVYYVIIEVKDKPLIYRKLAIMNRK